MKHFVPVNSWKEQIQCTRILVVTVTGRGSIPHVTSRVFFVDTFWSVSHGLPRQEHESLMQDGLRIDGKLWPCPSFHIRKSKVPPIGIRWKLTDHMNNRFYIYSFLLYVPYIYIYMSNWFCWAAVARISQVSKPHQEFVHAHLMTILQWLGVAKSGCIFHVCLGLPPMERSHIPPGEKENHRLKSTDW